MRAIIARTGGVGQPPPARRLRIEHDDVVRVGEGVVAGVAEEAVVVANPSLTAADVPGVRIELANHAGVAEIAVETAHSIGARNSVERMLAHQMALAHKSAFLLGRQLEAALPKASTDDNANLRATRLATAMSRLMGSYQQGTAALQRLRSGGQQTVVVQHVQVSEGGQAIVAGEIKAGGRRKRADGGPRQK
jgi:hypothetical protein